MRGSLPGILLHRPGTLSPPWAVVVPRRTPAMRMHLRGKPRLPWPRPEPHDGRAVSSAVDAEVVPVLLQADALAGIILGAHRVVVAAHQRVATGHGIEAGIRPPG